MNHHGSARRNVRLQTPPHSHSPFFLDAQAFLRVSLRLGTHPTLPAAPLPLCHPKTPRQGVHSPCAPATITQDSAKVSAFGARGCFALKPQPWGSGSLCIFAFLQRLYMRDSALVWGCISTPFHLPSNQERHRHTSLKYALKWN